MPATIYSTRFIAGSVAAGSHLTYTVPAGFTAVVRDIALLPSGSGLTGASVQLSAGGYIWAVVTGVSNTTQQWTGRVVVNAGESFITNSAGVTTNWIVSGYLLQSI